MKSKRKISVLSLILALALIFSSCALENPYSNGSTTPYTTEQNQPETPTSTTTETVASINPNTQEGNAALSKPDLQWSSIAPYANSPYIAINGNVPQFYQNQITQRSYEYYSSLDSLGRCGIAVSCVGIDIMPTEPRESISSVKPSGWKNKEYDTTLVDGGWLYNRCHLLGFQLTGENANERNLITGTRYFNVDGMLPFENMVADYVKETGNHVMLRVTPIYNGDELVARGVQMEGYSVEDAGDGISFNVFIYNVQPGVTINYATGDSALADSGVPPTGSTGGEGTQTSYVLNTNTKKFHDPSCRHAEDIAQKNRLDYTGTREAVVAQGYTPCGTCKP